MEGFVLAARTLYGVLQVLSWEALETELRARIAAADQEEAPFGSEADLF